MSQSEPDRAPVSFLVFYLLWAKVQGWAVPDIHVRACHWLEHRGLLAVLRCFRGFGKSTLLDAYDAWRYYTNRQYRIMLQSESDKTAYKNSRDVQDVLRRHPLTSGLLSPHQVAVEQWWVWGATDPRNASMYARGILSNVTSSRADEIQNDDVEVPRNIQTPEAREKLRYRLSEQVHILLPGGRRLFVGTPHTHDSLYDELEAMGADCLTIRMFSQEYRVEDCKEKAYLLPFVPEFVFVGIGKNAKLLEPGKDYLLDGQRVAFRVPPKGLVDFYRGCAWPDRFNREELLRRRRETRTINEWDSQYQLHSKPIREVRLNPERVIPYEVEPELRMANRHPTMWLGKVQIVAMAMRWDPAGGKLHSDVSSVSLVLQDHMGRRYWHRAVALEGEVAKFTADGKKITGGQVFQLCELIQQFNVPRVTVETNGIGAFAPAVLKACLKQFGLQCGVTEIDATEKKNKRILEAFEAPLSSGMLWAHVSVLETVWDQMQEWNPAITKQPDDHLDSGAGAITDTPERIKIVRILTGTPRQDWRPSGGVHEATLEL